jgi:hypothetical protein
MASRAVHHPLGAAEADELVGFEIHRHPAGYLFRAQVEALAGDRAADGGDEHQAVLIQLAGDPSTSMRRTRPLWQKSMPSSTPSGWAVTKLPLTTLMRAPAWGVGEPHGELGGDVVLQTAAHLLDDGETGIVGDPDPLVILGLDAGAGQGLVVLRTRTKHQHQADPKVCSRAMSLTMLAKLG